MRQTWLPISEQPSLWKTNLSNCRLPVSTWSAARPMVAYYLIDGIASTDAWPGATGVGARGNNETKGNKSMHAVIRHYISDPAKWDRSVKNIMSMIEQQRLPGGLKPLVFLPGVDGRNADCVWEAVSLRTLQQFVERETAGARNEYFELNAEAAIGLPKGEELLQARAA
jgi:hypothetical protein